MKPLYCLLMFQMATVAIDSAVSSSNKLSTKISQIFSGCTLHFTHFQNPSQLKAGHPTVSFQENFEDLCAILKNCVSLHSSRFFNKLNSTVIPLIILPMFETLYREMVSFQNVFFKLFIATRFSTICIVYFPRIYTRESEFILIDHWYYVTTGYNNVNSTISASSQFLLVPYKQSANTLKFIAPVLLNALLVFIETSKSSIFLGKCNHELGVRTRFHHESLRQFFGMATEGFEVDIRLVSVDYNITLETLRQSMIQMYARGPTHLGNQNDFKFGLKFFQKGSEIISNFYNCTNSSLCSLLSLSQPLSKISNYDTRTLVSYGNPSLRHGGIVYVLLEGNSASTSILEKSLSLFYSLGWLTWLGVLLTIITYCVVLKQLVHQHSIFRGCFWMLTTFLEQGDDGMLFRNKFCEGIVMMWLLFTIFLRQFYTSDLYSSITSTPYPDWLPKSSKELLSSTESPANIKLFAEYNSTSQLNAVYSKLQENKAAIKLRDLMKLYLGKLIQIDTKLTERGHLIQNENWKVRTSVPVKVEYGNIIYGNIQWLTMPPSNNIGLFYYKSHLEEVVFVRHLSKLFGNRIIYVNNEAAYFIEPRFYVLASPSVFAQVYLKKFAQLHSSGIHQYLEHVLWLTVELLDLLKMYVAEIKTDVFYNLSTYARLASETAYRTTDSFSHAKTRHTRIIPDKFELPWKKVSISDVWICFVLLGLGSLLSATVEFVILLKLKLSFFASDLPWRINQVCISLILYVQRNVVINRRTL